MTPTGTVGPAARAPIPLTAEAASPLGAIRRQCRPVRLAALRDGEGSRLRRSGVLDGDSETELTAGLCGRSPTDTVLSWKRAKHLLRIG